MARMAIAYTRVSTDDQQLGPDAQRAAIEAWAARERISIEAWHTDHGVSGAAALDRRPGLMAALADLRRGSVLVAAKRCRLARDVVAAATIERLVAKAGASVSTADGVGAGGGPEAALLRTMVDAFAAYERAVIRSRTSAALRAKRARGEATGGTARYGELHLAGRVHDNTDELEAVARIAELHEQGLGCRRIAAALDAEGFPCRGKAWRPGTVAKIVRRRKRAPIALASLREPHIASAGARLATTDLRCALAHEAP